MFSGNWDDAFDDNISDFENDSLSAGGLTVTLDAQTEVFAITGSSGNDTITGGAGGNLFYDSAGTDILLGGAGYDRFLFSSYTDLADSTINGGGNLDRAIFQTAFNTLGVGAASFDGYLATLTSVNQLELFGSSSIDIGTQSEARGISAIVTGTGNTTVSFDSGRTSQINVLAAGSMADGTTLTLEQGTGATALFYVDGLKGDIVATSVTSYVHAIAATGTGFAVNFQTGDGADELTGSAGADTLSAGAGNDMINGGDGNDTITSGAGDDTLTGAGGDDRFVFNAAWGVSGDASGLGRRLITQHTRCACR